MRRKLQEHRTLFTIAFACFVFFVTFHFLIAAASTLLFWWMVGKPMETEESTQSRKAAFDWSVIVGCLLIGLFGLLIAQEVVTGLR